MMQISKNRQYKQTQNLTKQKQAVQTNSKFNEERLLIMKIASEMPIPHCLGKLCEVKSTTDKKYFRTYSVTYVKVQEK